MNHLLTAQDKKNIYNVLADAYIEVIDRQAIGKYERKTLAQKILDKVGAAKTTEDIRIFIHDLVKNYPFFQFSEKILTSEVGRIQEESRRYAIKCHPKSSYLQKAAFISISSLASS